MILLGRLVSGAGSSNIPIIITYLTRITPSDRKTRVLTSVNTFASVRASCRVFFFGGGGVGEVGVL